MSINASAPTLTTMDFFMRHLALKPLSKMVWLSEKTVLSLKLPELYSMVIMCLPDIGPMRSPLLSTFLIDFHPKSYSFRLLYRSWRLMSPYPRSSCSLPEYLDVWPMCTFTKTNAPNWTPVPSAVFSWATPCTRKVIDAMTPLLPACMSLWMSPLSSLNLFSQLPTLPFRGRQEMKSRIGYTLIGLQYLTQEQVKHHKGQMNTPSNQRSSLHHQNMIHLQRLRQAPPPLYSTCRPIS